jgi:voltage-gated potassium channel
VQANYYNMLLVFTETLRLDLKLLVRPAMDIVRQAVAAVILVAATLWLECGGIAILIHWARGFIERGLKGLSPLQSAVLIIQFAAAIVVLHLVLIALWAGFYRFNCLPSWESSFYFSATSYSTVGYGDVVLPRDWRALGPVEGITGVLMTGLSVSVLFAIATRLLESGTRHQSVPEQGKETYPIITTKV